MLYYTVYRVLYLISANKARLILNSRPLTLPLTSEGQLIVYFYTSVLLIPEYLIRSGYKRILGLWTVKPSYTPGVYIFLNGSCYMLYYNFYYS